MDEDLKKAFLQQGAALYNEMIKLTTSDVIRRYLAFRIIVNAMSFEDLIRNRQSPRMRKIRDVLLAHKQEDDFFKGFSAVDEITNATIAPLVAFIDTNTGNPDATVILPELSGGSVEQKFRDLLPQVFQLYEEQNLSGLRVINNYLCYTGTSVQEITKGELAGAFYRYNSSMALFDMPQYIYNNSWQDPDFLWMTRHAKLDQILHAQNIADCAIKDQFNSYSMDGLLEIMISHNLGDPSSLVALKNDARYKDLYGRVREVRNKLIGHMDRNGSFADLIALLDALPTSDLHELVNLVDKAVFDAGKSDHAVRMRYVTRNMPLTDHSIVAINGYKAKPYF